MTPSRALLGIAVACAVFFACSEHSPTASEAADAFGATFQGDGVQCGAIVCSGSQQCCFVDIPTDANSAAPTHKCDQGCESVCMDACPDAGNGMGGMGGMGGMTAPRMPTTSDAAAAGPGGGGPHGGGPAAPDGGAHP